MPNAFRILRWSLHSWFSNVHCIPWFCNIHCIPDSAMLTALLILKCPLKFRFRNVPCILDSAMPNAFLIVQHPLPSWFCSTHFISDSEMLTALLVLQCSLQSKSNPPLLLFAWCTNAAWPIFQIRKNSGPILNFIAINNKIRYKYEFSLCSYELSPSFTMSANLYKGLKCLAFTLNGDWILWAKLEFGDKICHVVTISASLSLGNLHTHKHQVHWYDCVPVTLSEHPNKDWSSTVCHSSWHSGTGHVSYIVRHYPH